MEALVRRARLLAAADRVVLGLDTAADVLAMRLRTAGVLPTTSAVAAYREMLLGAADSRVAGVVVPPEAVPAAVAAVPCLVGVRADTGRDRLGARSGTVAAGLDGLAARLAAAHQQGATFAAWHAGPDACLHADAHAAARFALASQDAGLVPVVRIGTACDVSTQVGVLLSFFGQVYEFDLARDAIVVVTRNAPDAMALLPADLGGVVADRALPRGRLGLLMGATATLPALAAWRGSDVESGRQALRRVLDAACAPGLALAAGR
jgi:hypothetical protein